MNKKLLQEVYINDKGFYFEQCIEDKKYTLETLLAKKPLVKPSFNAPFSSDEFYYIFAPSLQQLLSYFESLKKTSFLIVLLPQQQQEKKFLASYYRIRLIPVTVQGVLRLMGLNDMLDEETIQEAAAIKLGYKIAYCLGCVGDSIKLNPSYLQQYNNSDLWLSAYSYRDFKELDLNQYPLTKILLEVYSSLRELPMLVFYELLFADLTDKKSLKVCVFEKILCGEKLTPQEQEEYERLDKEGFFIAENNTPRRFKLQVGQDAIAYCGGEE